MPALSLRLHWDEDPDLNRGFVRSHDLASIVAQHESVSRFTDLACSTDSWRARRKNMT